jgi:hypothetical protein
VTIIFAVVVGKRLAFWYDGIGFLGRGSAKDAVANTKFDESVACRAKV